jgi:hypothetical protein
MFPELEPPVTSPAPVHVPGSISFASLSFAIAGAGKNISVTRISSTSANFTLSFFIFPISALSFLDM